MAAAAVVVALVKSRSEPDGPLVVVGAVGEFPVGSIAPLDLEVKLTEYVPRVSDTAQSEIADIPIFLVNYPLAGPRGVVLVRSAPGLSSEPRVAASLRHRVRPAGGGGLSQPVSQ